MEKIERRLLLMNMVLPLMAGAMVYILLSPDAYITRAFWSAIGKENPLRDIQICDMPYGIQFIRYHCCDFLWAMALYSTVILVMGKDRMRWSILITTIFIVGMEGLQLSDAVSGTFDLMDIVVEVLAGWITYFLFMQRRRLTYEESN